MAIALVACNKKEEPATPTQIQQSAIDTPITATTSWKYTDDYYEVMKACTKISTLSNILAEAAATTFDNPINEIRFIKSRISEQKCYVTVATSNGPQDCYVPAIIKFSDGRYSAAAPAGYKRCP